MLGDAIQLPLVLAIPLVCAMIVLWNRIRTRRILESMSRMLDEAIQGQFRASHYDESLQSAVEARLAQYLAASQVASQDLRTEKDRIQNLISDISHQTKTPISNILLYGQLLQEQELKEPALDYVRLLNAQADKLHFLIDVLVKTSRLESGILKLHPVLTPIEELIDSTVDPLRIEAEKRQICIQIEPTDLNAYFDPNGRWRHCPI